MLLNKFETDNLRDLLEIIDTLEANTKDVQKARVIVEMLRDRHKQLQVYWRTPIVTMV